MKFRYALLVCLMTLCCLIGCDSETQKERPVLALEYRGTELTIGMSEDEALAALGDDYTVTEADSCAGIGVDRMYAYPSLRLYVFAPADGVAGVTSVSYTDDGADIAGVHIGSAIEAVTAAFGEPDEQSEQKMLYRRDGVCLMFSLRDGRISAIVLSKD